MSGSRGRVAAGGPGRSSRLSRVLREHWCPILAVMVVGSGIVGAAPAAEPDRAAAGRRADLAAFRERFLARDRSYSAAARVEAEERLRALERALAEASQAYFELELGRVVALADNGHTSLSAGVRSRHFNRVPVRLAPFGEEFFVLRARAEHVDLLGGRLVSIDRRPVAELRAEGRALQGGVAAWRDRFVPYLLESPEQLHALHLVDGSEAAVYRLALPDGREVERRLVGEPASADRPRANADRWMFPELMKEEGTEWRSALTVEKAPWSLSAPSVPFSWRLAEEGEVVVIELRRNEDRDEHRIGAFVRDVERALATHRPTHAVLDLRMNGGGDLTTTREFAQKLPGLIAGRIFVLTSPWTFSAAISTLGYLEQSAPARVTIVGEPIGDRLEMFGEGGFVELPSSGLVLRFADERHDYRTGCRGKHDCHRAVVRQPIAVESLEPDLLAAWTIDDYLAGYDPAMVAVGNALGLSPGAATDLYRKR